MFKNAALEIFGIFLMFRKINIYTALYSFMENFANTSSSWTNPVIASLLEGCLSSGSAFRIIKSGKAF